MGRPVMGSACVVNGQVLIGSDDGYVYCFR
ncbi:PQQ-binding-like beta-propeller repeat protein [Armatimonas sp.]